MREESNTRKTEVHVNIIEVGKIYKSVDCEWILSCTKNLDIVECDIAIVEGDWLVCNGKVERVDLTINVYTFWIEVSIKQQGIDRS